MLYAQYSSRCLVIRSQSKEGIVMQFTVINLVQSVSQAGCNMNQGVCNELGGKYCPSCAGSSCSPDWGGPLVCTDIVDLTLECGFVSDNQ